MNIDVTSPATGTTYVVTNPEIVSVSAGGLVTAKSAGRAIIAAYNEGAMGLIAVALPCTSSSEDFPVTSDWD